MSVQHEWRWCSKDQCLFYAGNAVCPAGGVHSHAASGYYSLMSAGGQMNWKWCKKCQVLSYTGDKIGVCTAGGVHDVSGSGNYGLASDVSARGQQGWKWCNKCRGLAYAQGADPGKCQAGGNHDHGGSGDYVIALNGDPGKNSQENPMYYDLAGFEVASLGVVSKTETFLLFLSLQILFSMFLEAKASPPRAFAQISAPYSAN